MELIELVSELLYTHNCVIIPGFGGFVGNFKHTEFDESRMLLSPARKKVAFNRSLQENDGLLINGLVKRKGISYEQAEKEVTTFVGFMNDRLEKYRNYEFRNIGSFYLNKDNNLIFVAYEGLNFFKKSYGLQDVKVRPLQSVAQPQTESALLAEEEVKIVPLQPAKRRFYIPQIAASVVILAAFGLVLWQFILPSQSNQGQPTAAVQHEDSPAQSASIIPDLTPSDEIVQPEAPEIKEVTEDLIKSGDLPDVVNQPETESTQEENLPDEPVIDEVEPEPNVQPMRLSTAPKIRRYPNGVDAHTPGISLSQPISEEIIEEETAEPVAPKVIDEPQPVHASSRTDGVPVYYVAVAKLAENQDAQRYSQRLDQLHYSELIRQDSNGVLHLCVERFTDEKNARNYLNLVRRYDFHGAYLIEIQE